MYVMKLLKDAKVELTNKGEELVISVKSNKDHIASLEKKLKAMQELCCDDECCGNGCCREQKGGCC